MVGLRRALIPAAVLMLAGCHGSTQPAAVAPTTTVTTNTRPTASSSTTVAIQASGPRTVLSPIGVNLRSQASKTAPVVGTAAQGVTLTVLSHTDQEGGWYQVKGATVTGFITDNPTVSDNGKFAAYSSSQHNFSALYPDNWTSTEAPPDGVVFHPASGGDTIVVSNAPTTSQLGKGRAGYRRASSAVVVACGVTGDLVTFVQTGAPPSTAAGGAAAERYLVQVRLTLDAQHALGVDANLADLGRLQVVKDVVNSLSFPFPQCEEGATPIPATTSP